MDIKLLPADLKSKAELIKNLVSGIHYYAKTTNTTTEYWYEEHSDKLFCFKVSDSLGRVVQQGSFLPSVAHVQTMHIKAEWYTELDGNKEILCMVWEDGSYKQVPAYVKKYHQQIKRKYEDTNGTLWQYARPITDYDYERKIGR